MSAPTATTTATAAAPKTKNGWHCASTAGIVIGALTLLLLIIGLGVRTVMSVKYSQTQVVSIVPLITVDATYEVKISYYDAKAKISANGAENEAEVTMDDMTCGNAGAVKAGGAFHFLAMFACIPMIVAFVLDRDPKWRTTPVTHLPIVTLVVVQVLLIFMDIALGDARAKSNHEKCNTVPPGLVRYAVGGCWILAILAQIPLFIMTIVYAAQRYGKCCCYDASAEAIAPAPEATADANQTRVVAVEEQK